jgi:hypothetical protein
MNNQQRLQTIIAPLMLGIGIAFGIDGINSSAVAYPDNSTIDRDYHNERYYPNYHRDAFRDVQPFRSLHVTPQYNTPPRYESDRDNRDYRDYSRYNDYDHDDYDDYDDHDERGDRDYYDDCDNCRQRRVFRRGIRQPDDRQRSRDYQDYRDYDRDSDRQIEIRIR